MPSNSKEDIKELLLEDYKYLQTSFWKNEETGETRVRFYITLVTAVLAAVATLLTKQPKLLSDDLVLYISITSLFTLLLFGIVTLLRIIKRNQVTDGYKKDMDEIRKRFRQYYDENEILTDYLPFRGSVVKAPPIRKLGGLSHTVSVINSVVAAVLIGLPSLSYGLGYAIVISLVSIVLFMLIQYLYIKREGHCNKVALYRPDYTHAGGIVFKADNKTNQYLYLLVTAKTKDGTEQWVLPKGHIERCENPQDTAIREVKEEAGISGEIIDLIGVTEFKRNAEQIKSAMYLMQFKKTGKAARGEEREIHWLPYEKAHALLSFDDAKIMLEAGNLYAVNKNYEM